MQRLPAPKDGKTKVLRDLLTKPSVSFKNYRTGFALRSRIADLRNKHRFTGITTTEKKFKNEFGRPGTHAVYTMVCTSTAEKQKLIDQYLSLVKKPTHT